jgi:hypothetical protein
MRNQAGLIPWGAVYLEKTRTAFQQDPELSAQVIGSLDILKAVFSQYCTQISASTEGDPLGASVLTFKALSRMLHDLGVCPLLLGVQRVYELFSDLLDRDTPVYGMEYEPAPFLIKIEPTLVVPYSTKDINFAQFVECQAAIAFQVCLLFTLGKCSRDQLFAGV